MNSDLSLLPSSFLLMLSDESTTGELRLADRLADLPTCRLHKETSKLQVCKLQP